MCTVDSTTGMSSFQAIVIKYPSCICEICRTLFFCVCISLIVNALHFDREDDVLRPRLQAV